jgi:hypothetical protein
MGLPQASRYPVAAVLRSDDRFEIVFSGDDGARTIDVPYRLFGALDDLESVELHLLADLQRLGYDARREALPG